MQLSIKIEVIDDDGKAIAGGGVLLDEPSDERARYEISLIGDRVIGFLNALRPATKAQPL